MSYILDALRRADSERERGNVPSIHAPPAPLIADDPKPSGGNARALVGVIVVLLLALAGVLAWHLFGGKAAPARAVNEQAAVLDDARMPPGGFDAARTAPQGEPPRQTAQPTAATPATTSAPVPRQSMQSGQAPQPIQRQPRAASPTATPGQLALSVPATPPAATPTASPQTATPEADTRVHSINDLPADIQRDLPKLVVGGAMYSDTPAKRMLIINSQVFHEGDKLSPDLLLQEVKLKSAVFNYKGYRYSVSY